MLEEMGVVVITILTILLLPLFFIPDGNVTLGLVSYRLFLYAYEAMD